MKVFPVNFLENGLYRLHWFDGGNSIASVGRDENGRTWFAPANWIRVPSYEWSLVKSADLILTHGGFLGLGGHKHSVSRDGKVEQCCHTFGQMLSLDSWVCAECKSPIPTPKPGDNVSFADDEVAKQFGLGPLSGPISP